MTDGPDLGAPAYSLVKALQATVARLDARVRALEGGPSPVFATQPTVTGTPTVGQPLSSLTFNDGTVTNGTVSSRSYMLNGVSLLPSYVFASGDVGGQVVFQVTATGATGTTPATATVLSATIVAAAVAAPVNSVAPAVTGAAAVGSTLTVTTGTWSGSPTYAYQWRRDGAAISGATNATYIIVSADAGHSVTCRVSATNAGGTAGATSNAVAVPGSVSYAGYSIVLARSGQRVSAPLAALVA